MSTSFVANPIRGIKVLLVSTDDETIDGTEQYLTRVGASAQSVTTLAEAVEGAKTAHAVGTWLPFALIFFSTWLTGFLVSTMPWPKSPAKTDGTGGRVAPGGTDGARMSLDAR